MIYEAVKLVTATRPNLGFYYRNPDPPCPEVNRLWGYSY